MTSKHRIVRIDFVKRFASFNHETGGFEASLLLDPERYEMQSEWYVDKFDSIFYPIKTIEALVSQLSGIPILHTEPKIGKLSEYVASRIPKINLFLNGASSEPEFHDASEEFLQVLGKKAYCAVLFADVKGSTILSQEVSPAVHSLLISLFLRETALLIEKFNGLVLKYVGDGVVAYFPGPDVPAMNDNAVDCALALKELIFNALNQCLRKKNLPELSFGIGIDSGEMLVNLVGVEDIKLHRDLLGETINLAAKIQGLTKVNQVLVGESTLLALSSRLRARVKHIETPLSWKYVDSGTGEPYALYEIS